jgi:GTP pyrophosphokinase
MVEDVRVVLIRLASRTQTLRWFAKNPSPERNDYAKETLDIYSPLANRLGVFQLKWELEDLSFRYLEPELYKRIAQMLDERRVERQQYIADSIATLARELEAAGVKGEISGRPKHIYSIWNKMRNKGLDFSQVYDVRALRVIVPEIKDCYTALGVVHNLWQPIPKEFDDYISRPKGNLYQSLHTAVLGPSGKTLEVQIRTEEMHRQAEYGVAAHWQYKEKAKASKQFEEKIAWLRELLAWRDEVADWSKARGTRLDDTVYVLTPQGKVIDLPAGATPVDFAYALHTDLGHRCRGAKVDGHIVPLDTPLASGQRVEIATAKNRRPVA